MEARRAHGWRSSRVGVAGALACAALTGLAACGGEERQDKDEPSGRFPVEVVRATFPEQQKLAKRSDLVITVRNAGRRTIPNLAVTVDGFDKRVDDPDLADPERPVFVINGVPKRIGDYPEAKEAAPPGGETAYVNTWALGRLRPGKDRTFRWSVTAVKPGPFQMEWTVAAGLDGKAKAVDSTGNRPTGVFRGTITEEAPETRVAEDGKTVVEGSR